MHSLRTIGVAIHAYNTLMYQIVAYFCTQHLELSWQRQVLVGLCQYAVALIFHALWLGYLQRKQGSRDEA